MNKTILGLLLAVCVLGMALIMLNERLHKADPQPTPGVSAPATAPDAPPQADSARGAAAPQTPPLPKATHQEAAPPPDAAHKANAAAPKAADSAPVRAPLPDLKADAKPESAPDKGKPAAAPTQAAQPQPAVARPHPPATEKPAPAAVPQPVEKVASQPVEKPVKAAPQTFKITRFVVFARDTGATVRLVGTAPITYKATTLQSPERLVIDLDEQWQIKAPGVPKNPLVTNVRIGKAADKTRVVIDLSGKPARTKYVLSKDYLTLDIRVDQ